MLEEKEDENILALNEKRQFVLEKVKKMGKYRTDEIVPVLNGIIFTTSLDMEHLMNFDRNILSILKTPEEVKKDYFKVLNDLLKREGRDKLVNKWVPGVVLRGKTELHLGDGVKRPIINPLRPGDSYNQVPVMTVRNLYQLVMTLKSRKGELVKDIFIAAISAALNGDGSERRGTKRHAEAMEKAAKMMKAGADPIKRMDMVLVSMEETQKQTTALMKMISYYKKLDEEKTKRLNGAEKFIENLLTQILPLYKAIS